MNQLHKNKINYDRQMELILDGKKPDVLLHACCSPCSSAVLERLAGRANLTVFFYNPNIIPETEYLYRLQELKRLLREMPCAAGISLIEGNYEPDRFLAFAQQLAEEQERGERCRKCIAMRLAETAKQAEALHMDYFATTLTVSPHKDAAYINAAGADIAGRYGTAWLPSDFKKKNGYLRSVALSGEYCLYRQDFCGCPFSRKQREMQKAEQQNAKPIQT